MSDDILDFVSVRPLDRAQRVNVLKRLSGHPDAASVPHLPQAVANALAHEEELGALQRRRRETPRALHGPQAPVLDQRVDDLIAVLHGRLTLSVRFDPPPAAEGTHATLLLSALLPDGPGAITQRPYHEEHVAVGQLLALVAQREDLQRAVAALGHDRLFATLAAANEAYGAALYCERPAKVTGEMLRTADRRGRRLLAAIVARIVGTFPDDTPTHKDARARLLGHFVEVQRDDRARRRRTPAADPAPSLPAPEPNPPSSFGPLPSADPTEAVPRRPTRTSDPILSAHARDAPNALRHRPTERTEPEAHRRSCGPRSEPTEPPPRRPPPGPDPPSAPS